MFEFFAEELPVLTEALARARLKAWREIVHVSAHDRSLWRLSKTDRTYH
jgi:hypothetical protein